MIRNSSVFNFKLYELRQVVWTSGLDEKGVVLKVLQMKYSLLIQSSKGLVTSF